MLSGSERCIASENRGSIVWERRERSREAQSPVPCPVNGEPFNLLLLVQWVLPGQRSAQLSTLRVYRASLVLPSDQLYGNADFIFQQI